MSQPALEYIHPLAQVTCRLPALDEGDALVNVRAAQQPGESPLIGLKQLLLHVIPLHPLPTYPPIPAKNASKAKKEQVARDRVAMRSAWSSRQRAEAAHIMVNVLLSDVCCKCSDTIATYTTYSSSWNMHYTERDDYFPLDKLRTLLLTHAPNNETLHTFDFDGLVAAIEAQIKAHAKKYLESVNALKRRCEEMLQDIEERPRKRSKIEGQ